MELNDKVQVRLTEEGAKVLNENNTFLKMKFKSIYFKTDYKSGDTYTCLLWQLFEHFGCCNNAGSEHAFTGLIPFVEDEKLEFDISNPEGCPYETSTACILAVGGSCRYCSYNS